MKKQVPIGDRWSKDKPPTIIPPKKSSGKGTKKK